jgi:GT2 family glycosyltransferase
VDHIPTLNILYEKKTLQDFGGFDEAFRFACEDPELNHRLVKANYKIAYLNGLHVVHRFRPGFGPWIRRCFSYGKGRTQILLKHPDHLSLVLLVPQAIALLWLTAPMTFLNAPLLWNPVALYASFLFLYAAGLCTIKGKWHLSGHVFLLYLVTHFSFGLGQLWGLGLNGNRTAAGLNTQP